MNKDIDVLRGLASDCLEIANSPEMERRRKLWSRHFSLKTEEVPVIATYGMWNVWCREVFGDDQMLCEDPFYREHERELRMELLHAGIGDDYVLEPWITQRAHVVGSWSSPWGLHQGQHSSGQEGGSFAMDAPMEDLSDLSVLKAQKHIVDEEKTANDVARLEEAVGDILTVNVDRTPFYNGFSADISTHLTRLRGMEQLMFDMYEDPEGLHALLALMRDGILANNQAAEDAGDYTLTSQHNQAVPYADELEARKPNSGPRNRRELWGFCAAQELTMVSPAFHEEFMFNYQKPIMENFGLVHYGCCEDLTGKIDMLRKLSTLRSIAVSPLADLGKCVEQIGKDYAISWRPNPSDMVCCGWNQQRVESIIRGGLDKAKGTCTHIHLKDIETLEGDIARLKRWVDVVRALC